MIASATRERACPECGAALPVHEGFVTWCHQCGWNLAPPPALGYDGGSRLDRLYAGAGRRLGKSLMAELTARERLEPRLTPSKALAYAIAIGVYALTVALAVGGLSLVVLGFPNPFAIALGLVAFGAAVLMRPRLGAVPAEDVVPRSEAPALHDVAEHVAKALGTPPPDVVRVVPEYNASWSIVGMRRTRVLTLGLPLLALLDPQERVALIAHELAHARNGDATRGLLVGSAVDGLIELYGLVGPSDLDADDDIFARALNVVFYVLSRPIWWLLLLELHLLLRDLQRAEYLADALAARVAGTAAAMSLQEKLLLEPTFRAAVQHAATPGGGGTDLFAELARLAGDIPERERERRRRVARLEETRLDATHPPTALRLELLEGRQRLEPEVALSPAESAAVDDELRALRPERQRRLVEDYRDSLYA